MRILNDNYFLSPDKIAVDAKDKTIYLKLREKNALEAYFFEGIRIKDSQQIGEYSEVKVEFNIAQFSNWPILLDEFLRYIGEEGRVSFYFRNSKFVAKHACMHFLERLFAQKNIEAELTHMGPEPEGDLYVFKIKRSPRTVVQKNQKNWSLGILVDGKSSEMLDAFLASVYHEFQSINFEQKVEVIINGPSTEAYEESIKKYDMPIRFINTGLEFNHLGWITQKKNAIVKACQFENVALFHNRYALKSGWLKRFDDFGYDFEILALKQTYEGNRFPDWVAGGHSASLAQSFLLNPNDYHPNLYINGGVIVGKKWVLDTFPLNQFLFWDQAEDIAHTNCMMSNGILPRYAYTPDIEVLAMRKGFMSGFKEQNKICQAIGGYQQRLTHFSPLYAIKHLIKRYI